MKIEPPDGDSMQLGAPSWYDAINAGKEVVRLDLKEAAGLAEAQALCDEADVILDGFRPGVFERLGLQVPARAVFCAITGFGTEGRHALRAGHDINYVGWAGLLADTAPAVPPTQVADLAAGALGALVEILAALLERERTSSGTRITISMTHGAHRLAAHRLGGESIPKLLTGGPPCFRVYGTADGRLPDGRRARAEVLAAPLRADRAARPRRAPLRPVGGDRPRRGVPRSDARRLARAVRRRGRLRRPRLDARGGGSRVRRAVAPMASAAGSRCRSRRRARARTRGRPSCAPSPRPR